MPVTTTWSAPRDWAVAEVVTAANMDQYISSNLLYLYIKAGGQHGVAFPGSPAAYDFFFRTDLGSLWYWTGLMWKAVMGNTGARVYNNAAISVTNITTTVLTFNTERWDTDTIHSTSVNTGRLTCVTPGTYYIWGNVQWASSAVGIRQLSIRANGSTVIGDTHITATAAGQTISQVSTVYALVAADYVELTGFQNTGGALNIEVGANYAPEFLMQRVG